MIVNLNLTATGSIVAEEVVVESSLNVRNPSASINRRGRNTLHYRIPETLAALVR